MKSKKIIRIYMKLMTKSPVLFLSYLIIFVGITLYLTLVTEIDVFNTYTGLIKMQNGKSYIVFDGKLSIDSEKVYTYIDKNSEVYEINIQSVSCDSEKSIYEVNCNNNLITDFFIKGNGKEMKVDIPNGKTTLFTRVFLKGGKA